MSILSKTASLAIIILFMIVQPNQLQAENNHSSLVIVKIDGLNTTMFNKLNDGISKNSKITLEYSCLQSDIVVVKYNHGFAEKGDVQHFINNNFKKWAQIKNVEFVFIDIQTTGVSKC